MADPLRNGDPVPSMALPLDDWDDAAGKFDDLKLLVAQYRRRAVGLAAHNAYRGRVGDIYHSVHRWSPRGAVVKAL